ncbi:Uncharacterised protein [Lysinibacillus sphaericus]|nr:Uncharacterised protein [Lysinibacillus sphaericus]
MDIRFYDSTNKRGKRELISEDFESQMSAPTTVFAYHLSKNKSFENISQINIFCNSEADTYFFENESTDGFWEVTVPYNPNELLAIQNEIEKTQSINKLLERIFTEVFIYKNWDLLILKKALVLAEKLDFRNEFLLPGTPKKSPNREFIAIVHCIEELTVFKMICLIYDSKGRLFNKEILIETWPSPFIYSRFIGKPIWISDKEFSVQSKTSQWSASIEM